MDDAVAVWQCMLKHSADIKLNSGIASARLKKVLDALDQVTPVCRDAPGQALQDAPSPSPDIPLDADGIPDFDQLDDGFENWDDAEVGNDAVVEVSFSCACPRLA